MTIEFPGPKQDEGAEEAAVPEAAETETAAESRGRGMTLSLSVLLLAALAAVGVLFVERQALTGQVAALQTELSAAQAREAQVEARMGQVATQLEAIQSAVAGLLGQPARPTAPAEAGETR